MKHILILFTLSGLMAQKHDRYEKDRWDDAPVRSERMESMVIWRLTDHLELSSEQAEKFFPRFREHREEIKQLDNDQIYTLDYEFDKNRLMDMFHEYGPLKS